MLTFDIDDKVKYYTPREIADNLGVSYEAVHSWLTQGRLEGFRVGSKWRVTKAAIYKFIDESTGEPVGRIKEGEIVIEWHDDVIRAVDYWAAVLKTTRSDFVGNIVLDRLAKLSAETAVEGPKHQTLKEFAYDEKGELMTGKDLYTLRRAEYIKEYQQAIDQRDKERAEEAAKLN